MKSAFQNAHDFTMYNPHLFEIHGNYVCAVTHYEYCDLLRFL